MNARTMFAASAMALGLLACRSTSRLVPVVGPQPAVKALAGHWVGEYDSPLTGRSGTIDFTVAGDGDAASGVVVMIPAGLGERLQPWEDPALAAEPRAVPSVLTIRLIWVEGTRVNGVLAPYADPQTGRRLITTFDGQLVGDTIAGTFVTRPGATAEGETGRWVVTRER